MSQELSRDEFIAQMIATLAEQKVSNPNSFEKLKIRNANEIFKACCFDYPIIQEEEVTLLNQSIITYISNGFRANNSIEGFYLHSKLIENIIWKASSHKSTDAIVEQDLTILGATLFVILPSSLLSQPKIVWSEVFFRNSMNNTTFSWMEILQEFKRIFLGSNISIISNSMNQNPTIEGLCRIITFFSKQLSLLSTNTSNTTTTVSVELEYYIQNISTNDHSLWIDIVKDVLIHAIFLARDLMILYPNIIINEHLSAIINAIDSSNTLTNHSNTLNSNEYLMISFLAGLCNHLLSNNSINSNVSNVSNVLNVINQSNQSNILYKQTIEIMRIYLLNILSKISFKIEIILEGKLNFEAKLMIISIIQLLLTFDLSTNIQTIINTHEKLLNTRIIIVIVNQLIQHFQSNIINNNQNTIEISYIYK